MKKNLLIIPGWDGTKNSWKAFINIAEKEYNVFCLELPCFGDEPCPDEVWGVEEYADFVEEKIKELKLDNLTILAHSFGGQVASYLLAKKPYVADKLILSGVAVIRPKNNLKNSLAKIIAKAGKIVFSLPILNYFEKVAKKILYRLVDSPDYSKTSGIKREIFKKVINQDFSHLLPQIKAKTLLVWGEFDTYVPLEVGKMITQAIPGAELKIFKKGKHGLHIQRTEELFEVVKGF